MAHQGKLPPTVLMALTDPFLSNHPSLWSESCYSRYQVSAGRQRSKTRRRLWLKPPWPSRHGRLWSMFSVSRDGTAFLGPSISPARMLSTSFANHLSTSGRRWYTTRPAQVNVGNSARGRNGQLTNIHSARDPPRAHQPNHLPAHQRRVGSAGGRDIFPMLTITCSHSYYRPRLALSLTSVASLGRRCCQSSSSFCAQRQILRIPASVKVSA